MGNKEVEVKEKKIKIIYTNGERYEGEVIQHNIRHGYGVYYYISGDRYEGFWFNNLRHGTGILFCNNGEIYEGWWQNDFMEGIGTFYHNNGQRYYGEWREGKKQGKGFIYFDDGSKFVGQFRNNKKFGTGEFTCGKTRNNYYQDWHNGVLVKQIEKYKIDKMDYVDFRELNTDSFEKYLGHHNSNFKSDHNSKYYGLELAKFLNSKNREKFYDSIQIIRKTNNLLLDKPNINYWNYEEVYLWFKQLNIKVSQEQIKSKLIDGESLLKYDFNKLISDLKINNEKDKEILRKSIDILRGFPKKRSSNILINYKGKENEEPNINKNKPSKILKQSIEEKEEFKKEICKENSIENEKSEGKKTHALLMNNAIRNYMEENKTENTYISIAHSNNIGKIKDSNFYLDVFPNHENDKNNKEIFQPREKEIEELDSDIFNLRTMTLNGLNFYINYDELRLLNKVGEGGFGEVFWGTWNGKDVAVKKLTLKQASKDRGILQRFINEINIISSLRHPNIVLYMGASIDKNHYYMITEYLPKGSLFDFLHRNKGKFSEKEQLQLAYEIAIGLKYLHSRHIIHCDLKSSNILLDDHFRIKIGDFGLSRFIKEKNPHENIGRIGTPHWMAPEILKGGNYQESADVFSYGMILWEILTQEIPYYGIDPRKLINIVAEEKKIVKVPKRGNEQIRKLTEECLNYEPSKRPSLKSVVEYLEIYIQSNLDGNEVINSRCKYRRAV